MTTPPKTANICDVKSTRTLSQDELAELATVLAGIVILLTDAAAVLGVSLTEEVARLAEGVK